MKTMTMLCSVVMLACAPMLGQVESRLKNQGDYQLATKFGTEVGMTTTSHVISARDAASGLPTGKRMHKPFVITKELDKSSPLLFRAMTNHQTVPSMELTYAGAPPVACATSKVHGGKVSLQDISIMKIEKISPTTEEVTIEYGSMTVTADGQEVDCGKAAVTSSK